MTARVPIVATDAAAIRSIGLDDWLANRAWPVQEPDFHALVDRVWSAFDAALAGLDGLEEVAFLADTAFVSTLIQNAHDLAVSSLAAQRGWRYVRGDGRDRPADLSVSEHIGALSRPIERRSVVARVGRRAAKRWVFNTQASMPRRWAAVLGASTCWLVGSQSPLKLAWARSRGLIVDAPDLAGLVSCRQPPPSPSPRVRDAMDSVLAATRGDLSQRLGVTAAFHSASEVWRTRHGVLMSASASLEDRRWPKVVMLGEVAKPWSKFVGGVARRAGSHIVADSHGLQVGHLVQRGLAWSECAYVDEYLCYNAVHRAALEQTYATTPIAHRRKVVFSDVPGVNAFAELERRLAATAAPSRGRTIMIVGHPMNPTRYEFSSGDFFAVQLALECEMSAVLRRAGFRTVYKAHPDRLNEIEGLIEGAFDGIEAGYLDRVWSAADGFVFGGLTTTALNVALLTDRPVALADFACLRWNADVRRRLASRVTLVPARIDDTLRAHFDAQALVAAFAEPRGAPDRTYARECLGLGPA